MEGVQGSGDNSNRLRDWPFRREQRQRQPEINFIKLRKASASGRLEWVRYYVNKMEVSSLTMSEEYTGKRSTSPPAFSPTGTPQRNDMEKILEKIVRREW